MNRTLGLALACGFGLAWMVAIFWIVAPAKADVGVQPILPGGSSIKPEGETPIQMAAEQVVMTVRPATEADNAAIQLSQDAYGLQFQPVWFPAMAEVEADFRMKNPTPGMVNMTAWFPLASALENVGWELNPDEIVPRIQGFQVTRNGDPLDFTVSELPNPKGEEKPPLPWASFPVTFPAGQDTNLHVSYVVPLQPSIKGYEMALYYVFQTGAGWAGPIGQADLIVNLPYPASVETMAGMPDSGLRLPPMSIHRRQYDPPSGAILDGNQASWTWKDFEPDSQDDFAVWLIQPDKWQELEIARAAVQANPDDGKAWLSLASMYRSLATSGYNQPSLFASSYLPPGIEAYQKAAELLPQHPAAHSGLALLSLAPYMADKNAPGDVLQTVQDELLVARELEAEQPDLAQEGDVSSFMVEEALRIYDYNDATATAEWSIFSTQWARATAEAQATLGLPMALMTEPPTILLQATETVAPLPSRTPMPKAMQEPAASPTTAAALPTSGAFQTGGGLLMCVAGGILGLSILYLLLKALRRG